MRNQHIEKGVKRISKISAITFVFLIGGYLFMWIGNFIEVSRNLSLIFVICSLTSFLIGIFLGISALIVINRNKTKLKGKVFALISIVFGTIGIFQITYLAYLLKKLSQLLHQ